MKNMIMTVANQVKVSRLSKYPRPLRIMLDGDTQCANSKGCMDAMMLDSAVGRGASRGNKMLVTGIIAVDQVYLAAELFEVGQHEGRNEIPAVKQQFCPFLVGTEDSPAKVRNVVMTVG